MKAVRISFFRFVKEIFFDAMLASISVLPIFLGLLFKFGVPFLETFLVRKTGLSEILAPYYLLFDLTIMFATPIMFGYAGLMVILEERDSGVMKYLSVTPLGTKGYLFSRLVFISAISAIYGFVVELFLHLSDIDLLRLIFGNIFGFLSGIWIVSLVAALASNKVEGLALSKFSGILILGPFASFFIEAPFKYLAFFLPTFWFTEYCLHENADGFFSLIFSFGISALYLFLSLREFVRKGNR